MKKGEIWQSTVSQIIDSLEGSNGGVGTHIKGKVNKICKRALGPETTQ